MLPMQRGLRSIPGQRTRSHLLQLKIPSATIEPQESQINIKKISIKPHQVVNIWVLNWVAITSRPISKKEDWREACWTGEMPEAWNQGHGRIPPSWCPGWTWRTHPAARREACYPGLKEMTTPEYVSSTLFFTGRMTWHIVSFISSQWYLLSVNDLLKFFLAAPSRHVES